MRFHLGAIPPTPDFCPEEEGWTKLHEPGPVVMQFLALPLDSTWWRR